MKAIIIRYPNFSCEMVTEDGHFYTSDFDDDIEKIENSSYETVTLKLPTSIDPKILANLTISGNEAFNEAFKMAWDFATTYSSLKSCPFCGGPANFYIQENFSDTENAMHVICMGCEAMSKGFPYPATSRKPYDRHQATIKTAFAWNNRV